MPEFYMIFARKIFSRILGEGALSVFYAYGDSGINSEMVELTRGEDCFVTVEGGGLIARLCS